jgi:general secretion pathway protein K
MTPRRRKKTGASRRKRGARKGQRGVALVMVMGAIAILTVVLAEFQDETSAELAAATAQRDSVQAEYMARSAVNLSRLLIASEPTIRKAIAPLFMFLKRTPPQIPVWEFSDRLLGAFNDDESSKDFELAVGASAGEGKNLGMPGGHYELNIVDEDAKINVNLGASNDIAHIRLGKELMGLIMAPQYSALFEQRDAKGQFHDRMAICQAIIDWADVDEQAFNCDMAAISAAQNAGVEDGWYQIMPYRRKNAPYDSLEELRQVRGVGEDFWATFVEPDATNPKKRILTVWGQGAVNINTANAQTILGVLCAGAPDAPVCLDASQASTFIMGVTMARGVTMGAPLFGSTKDFVQAMTGKGMLGPMLASIGMKPVRFRSESEFVKSISTESKVFSIYAVGVKKGYRRETRVKVHAVVDFRHASPLTAPGLGGLAGAAGLTGAQPTQTNPAAAALAAGGAAAMAQRPSTGGDVVYFRVE